MPQQHLVCARYAFAADENAGAGDQANPPFALNLAAERAFWPVPCDLATLRPASEDHPAATFSLTFSSSFARSFSASFGGVLMMSSINPYSFAASEVRK